MDLKQRAEQLKKLNISDKVYQIAKGATMRAVEKATELTPPTLNDLSGTNTRTGAMKQHWAADSTIVPQRKGTQLVTKLANNLNYASYVNDGHRLDRHFVPGLVINSAGVLERNPNGKGGIVVGTKTKYIKGKFMVEAAKKEYHKAAMIELNKLRNELK